MSLLSTQSFTNGFFLITDISKSIVFFKARPLQDFVVEWTGQLLVMGRTVKIFKK